jgi:acyl-lipid omega-6 desaturase (Delta-12 desaturase)
MKQRQLRLLNLAWRFWIPIFSTSEHCQIWLSGLKGSSDSRRASLLENEKLYAWALLFTYLSIVIFVPDGLKIALKLLPAVLIYMIMIEFFNMPHHVDAEIHEAQRPFPVWDHHSFTRSCKPIPFVGTWLFLDFNYHTAHHFFPTLPWHELKSTHSKLNINHSNLGELVNELSWHCKLRKTKFEVVFEKFRNH